MTEDGSQPKTRGWKEIGCLGVVGGFVALTIIGALLPKAEEGTTSPKPEAATSPPVAASSEPQAAPKPEPFEEQNDPGITAAEFAALKAGMTPKEVEQIVGSLGQVVSESEIAGIRTVMVQWPGERGLGANANAMFQNGKLIQKAQFGLH